MKHDPSNGTLHGKIDGHTESLSIDFHEPHNKDESPFTSYSLKLLRNPGLPVRAVAEAQA